MNDWIGMTLGKVKIESLLARGGMAEVYLGTHMTLQRKVAVKILREQYEDDPYMLERFQREAIVASRLRHPNIVQIYDFDAAAGHPYLVMEYISGPSLSQYLDAFHAKGRRLELPAISRLITSVASALEYAHKMGVIHRDVKPGNILLTSRTAQVIAGITMPAGFEPILTDFGLVRFLNSSRHTATGQITGTPAYMSPEQARGEATDERTDIYSLGVVLYAMLSGGRLRFKGETTTSILLKHIHQSVTPIPGLSPSVQDVLDLALAKDRNNRYASVARFARDFQAAVGTVSISDSREPETPLYRPPPITAKPKASWWRMAALAMLSLAIGTFFWLGRTPTQEAGIIPITGGTSAPTPALSQVAPVEMTASAVLQFRNGIAIADQAALIAQSLPLPPGGSQYEAWLVGGETRQSLGILDLDEQGNGVLLYSDSNGENLISLYDRVELSIEPVTNEQPAKPSEIVYAFAPGEGYIQIRHLLSLSPDTPNEVSIFQGLITTIYNLQQNTADMKTNYENGDESGMREKAEAVLNLLVGSQSPDFKDWNGDGEPVDLLDGFGLLPNGSQSGYLQALSSAIHSAANAPDATANLASHAEDATICTQNLSTWATSLGQTTLEILSAPAGSNLDQQVADSERFASQLMNGTDFDGDQAVEQLPGECGTTSILESVYRMADMPLLPDNLIPVETESGSE